MVFRALILTMSFLFFSCSGREPVDSTKSNSYFIQNDRYYYIQNGNRLSEGKHQLKNVTGRLLILNEFIAKDDKTVYYKNHPQHQVDRNSFVVQNLVKKDKNHVYDWDFFKLSAVADADPDTFRYEIIDSANGSIWARDANHYFASHHVVDVDFNSFQILNLMLAYDARHVYVRNGINLSKVANVAGAVKRVTKYFCTDNGFIYFYSFRKGFQMMPINIESDLTIINDDEIKVGDSVISVYR